MVGSATWVVHLYVESLIFADFTIILCIRRTYDIWSHDICIQQHTFT